MSRHFEKFVMEVLPWKTITVCLIMIAIAEALQVGIMLAE
jgi:hypothetical protein